MARMAYSLAIGLVATFLTVVSGEDPDKNVVPPAAPTFRAPKGWEKVDEAGIVAASFRIRKDDRVATMKVVGLRGEGGGLPANINRWRARLGLEKLEEKEALKCTRPLAVDGILGHTVDLTGSEFPDETKMRYVVAVVRSDGTTWFFTLFGPADLVGEAKPGFEELLKTVRFAK